MLFQESSYITLIDWLGAILFVIFLYIPVRIYYKKKKDDSAYRSYFLSFFWSKLLATVLFALYYQYIWGYGDTFSYFKASYYINSFFGSDPDSFWKLVFSPPAKTAEFRQTGTVIDYVLAIDSNVFQARLGSVVMFLTFKSYLLLSIFFSFLSFICVWSAYLVLLKLFPENKLELAIAFLFFPSIIFWTSGFGKDLICYSTLLLFLSSIYCVAILKTKLLKNLLALFASGSILYIVKPYILISLMPSLTFGIMLQLIKSNRNKEMRRVLFLLLPVLTGIALLLMSNFISSNFERFAFENITESIVNSNVALQYFAGSAFSIGIESQKLSSIGDLLKYLPVGLVTTLFRPFLWEAKNISMLLSALESLLIVYVTLYAIFKKGPRSFFNGITSSPILLAFFVFSLIFGCIVGISTSNFGSLIRYKIPCLSLYIFCILHIYNPFFKPKHPRSVPKSTLQSIT